MQSRLVGWKAKLLNLAERSTLIKTTLNTVPIYHLQTSLLPNVICNDIDKLSYTFLWKSGDQTRGVHLLNWEKVTLLKENSGLSIRMVRESNTTLLGKLSWDLILGKNKPWVAKKQVHSQ